MVKIVRDFVPKPRFMILCDASCSQLIAGEAQPASAEQASGAAEQIENQQMVAFVQAASQQGWKVGIDRQICPLHVKKESGNESRILIPSGTFNPQALAPASAHR